MKVILVIPKLYDTTISVLFLGLCSCCLYAGVLHKVLDNSRAYGSIIGITSLFGSQ